MKNMIEKYEKLKPYLDNISCSSYELKLFYTLNILQRLSGNRTHTADFLEISPRTLRQWMEIIEYFGLDIPNPKYKW